MSVAGSHHRKTEGFWLEGTAIYWGKRNNLYAKNHPYRNHACLPCRVLRQGVRMLKTQRGAVGAQKVIQIRNPRKHRGRNRTSCSGMLLPVCSTPSSPSLPPRVCPAAGRSERPEPAARAPLCSRGLLLGMPGSVEAVPACQPSM